MEVLKRQQFLFVKVMMVTFLLLALQTPLPASAAPFQSMDSYPLPGGMTSEDVHSADFNKDGHQDLATVSYGTVTGSINIYLGNGDGTFAAGVQYSGGEFTYAITSTDFNGDGHIDLATTSYSSNSISILLGNGDGTFSNAIVIPIIVSSVLPSISVADFNEDENMDVVVVSKFSEVYMLLGQGDGTFEPAVIVNSGSAPINVKAADLNADGNPDIVISDYDSKVRILLGQGDGTFAAQAVYTTDYHSMKIAIGDLNKDGIMDLVTANSNDLHGGNISVLMGKGGGTFKNAVNYSINGIDPSTVIIGDFIGDGEVDIMVGFFESSFFSILAGKGDGSFEAVVKHATSVTEVRNLASDDFNSDGALDVAVSSKLNNNIYVLLGNHRNADLQGLNLSGGARLSSTFSGSTLDYTTSVAYSMSSMTVTPIVADPTATVSVQVNGIGTPETVASSAESNVLPLNVGENKIEIVVTAQDGTTIQTYTITVTRANNASVVTSPRSANANLSELSLTGGVELSPTFTSDIISYTSNVTNNVDHVSLIPTLADEKATMKIRVNGGALENVASGDTSGSLLLNVRMNVIEVIVTAEDGTSRSYTIKLTREADTGTDSQEFKCPFTDIQQHWAETEICEATALGIVEGVSASTFAPDQTITRTEFAVMLLRTLQIPISEQAGVLPFRDQERIPKWAQSAIATGAAEAVLDGYPDGTFRSQQTISRSELAAMITKAMKWNVVSEGYLTFSDSASIPVWARAYVEAVYVNELMQGRQGNLFAPDGLTTRAEATVVLLRLWNTRN